MTKRYTGVLTKEENRYVARCLELDVTSQGHTVKEAQTNLHEALEIYMESFGVDEFASTCAGGLQ